MTDSLPFRGRRHSKLAQQKALGSATRVTFIRDILSRAELKRQDELSGRYPTISRTGDTRTGRNAVFFDDTKTVVYRENVIVSFPTTLLSESVFLTNDLRSTITASNASVTKEGSEQFVQLTPQNEAFRPFTETQHEVNFATSQFALTGSDITDVSLGFSSELKSKTIIRIPLEIAESTLFPSSAYEHGNYYYNKTLKRFEKIPSATFAVASQNPGARRPFGSVFSVTPSPAELFTPLGTPQSDYYAGSAGSYSFTSFGGSAGAAFSYDPSSLLSQATYVATSSQLLDLESYLHAPFLLEKAYVELPFSSSTGWYASPTAHTVLDGNVQLVEVQTHVGGPCVTFSLLNQLSTRQRELICSGTIVPERDCFPWFEWAEHQNGPLFLYRTLNGFTAFSTPGFRVPSSNFVGNAKLMMHAAQGHGAIYERFNQLAPATYFGVAGSDAPSVAPWGRKQTGVSGRSLFGGDFILPTITTETPRAHLSWSLSTGSTLLSGDFYLVNGIQNKNSPYLVFPNDNLIAYVSISTPAFANRYEAGAIIEWAPTASHSHAGIPRGTAYLTLYGSFVREGVEFHDTLNQRLETNQIHECVGFDAVLDQFDVTSEVELSGTYVDRIFLGTMGLQSSRSLVGSHFIPANDSVMYPSPSVFKSDSLYKQNWISSGFRNVAAVSSNERIFDSLVPSADDITKTTNDAFLTFISTAYLGGTEVGFPAGKYAAVGYDNVWDKAFPFEPRYSALQRKLSTNKLVITFNELGERKPTTVDISNIIILPKDTGRGFGGTEYIGDIILSTAMGCGLKQNDFAKYYYGFGDFNTVSGGTGTVNNPVLLFNTNVDVANPGGISVGPSIRGWKYGLFSGLASFTRCVFRRDRYGQVRDMLEQRLDTKFYNVEPGSGNRGILSSPVSVKFVDSSGVATLPEYTFSSNLSPEATSSLPYFDGLVRNRENPISLAKTNQSLVVI